MNADAECRRFYIEHVGCFVVAESFDADQNDRFAGGFWDLLESGENLTRLIWLDEDGFGFRWWWIAFEGSVDLVSDCAKKVSPNFATKWGWQSIGPEPGHKTLLDGIFGNLSRGRKTVGETIEFVAVPFKELSPILLHNRYVPVEGQVVTKGSDDFPPERRCRALRCSRFGATWISGIFRSKGSNFFQFFSEAFSEAFELCDFGFDPEQGLLHLDGVAGEPVFDILEAEAYADGALGEADAFCVGYGIKAVAIGAALRVEQTFFFVEAERFAIDPTGFG
jgi:hypothetical protein